jgi:hypothetical protein
MQNSPIETDDVAYGSGFGNMHVEPVALYSTLFISKISFFLRKHLSIGAQICV